MKAFALALGLTVLAASAHAADRPNTLTAAEKAAGWKLLFDGKSTAGWRGFNPASLARAIAALVARSPWLASRGGSTTMRDRSGGDGNTPASASVVTADRT